MMKQLSAVVFLGAGLLQGAVITSGYLNEPVFAKDYGSFSIDLSDGFHLDGQLTPLELTAPGELVNPLFNRLNRPLDNNNASPLVSGLLEINSAGFVTGTIFCPYDQIGRPDPACSLPSRGSLPYETVTGYGSFSGNTFTFAAAPVPEPSTALLLTVAAGWLLAHGRRAA